MIRGPVILVSAVDHPEHDDWVHEQATEEATRQGWTLGNYLGREDALGARRDPNLCCHVYGVEDRTAIDAVNAAAAAILVAHQRRDISGCLCGWAELGKSHPAHQVAKLREAGVLRSDQ